MPGTILTVFAFVLTLLAAFVTTAQPYWRMPPHLGWLGVSLYFLALLLR